jgi:hypothetical protein
MRAMPQKYSSPEGYPVAAVKRDMLHNMVPFRIIPRVLLHKYQL